MAEMSEHMIEAFREFVKVVTVPILKGVDATIDQVGTGTIFVIDDRYFLITAKHLFDGCAPEMFAVPSNPIRDPDPRTWGNVRLSQAKEEAVDLAVVEFLEPETIERVKSGWKTMSLANVGVASRDGSFALSGYPSQAAVRPREHLIGSTLLCFHTERVPTPKSASAPVHDDLDLFFEYGRTAQSGDRMISTPDLGGTSGCSIWEYRESAEDKLWSAEGTFKIVGVQSSMANNYSYFRAKSWIYVLQLLSQIDGGLKATIDAFRAAASPQ